MAPGDDEQGGAREDQHAVGSVAARDGLRQRQVPRIGRRAQGHDTGGRHRESHGCRRPHPDREAVGGGHGGGGDGEPEHEAAAVGCCPPGSQGGRRGRQAEGCQHRPVQADRVDGGDDDARAAAGGRHEGNTVQAADRHERALDEQGEPGRGGWRTGADHAAATDRFRALSRPRLCRIERHLSE